MWRWYIVSCSYYCYSLVSIIFAFKLVCIALPAASPWISLFYLLCFCTAVSTFVSHTVAAIILLPIVTTVGISLDIPEVVVISCAFAGKDISCFLYFAPSCNSLHLTLVLLPTCSVCWHVIAIFIFSQC